MNIIETIQKRRSVRTFTGEPLSNEHTAQIQQFINQLQAPFGIKARIELISIDSGGETPIKLGTYGWIKGAREYLALVYEEAPFAETAAAYMFEQAILFCTGLDLGTCWLGGSFSRSDFKKQIKLQPNERLRIVSPAGYGLISDKKRFLERYIVNADKKHATRKPFGELFFDRRFDNPLTGNTAGKYHTPLEMVRLAPSANNMQEWRVLFDGQTLHFYKKPYINYDSIDMGIALCHFELSCKELGIEGTYKLLNDIPSANKLQYVISWTSKQ